MKIEIVNPGDKSWTKHRYILWFGVCGPTTLLVWANSLDDALEECGDWLHDHAPGHFCDEQVNEEYQAALAEGLSEEDAYERATEDTTTLDSGHYLPSWEWGILAEDPTRAELIALQADDRDVKRCEKHTECLASRAMARACYHNSTYSRGLP